MRDTVRLHLNWTGWYVEQVAPPSKVREIRAAFDIAPDAPCLLPLPHPASAPRAYVESRLRAARPDVTIA